MKIKVTAKDSEYLGQEFEVVNESIFLFFTNDLGIDKEECKVVKRFVVKSDIDACYFIHDKQNDNIYWLNVMTPKKEDVIKGLKELGIKADKREIKIKK